jgi:hypothetical protein
MLTLTSTVTVLTAAFRLDKDSERRLEAILSEDQATEARFDKRGEFTVVNVARQKLEAADEWRRTLRKNAAQWIEERFPGFFCGVAPEQLPTISLLLTANYAPWQVAPAGTAPTWAHILDIASGDGDGYWQGNKTHPLRLNHATRSKQRHSLMIAACESDLLNPGDGDDKIGTLGGALNKIEEPISFLLAHWSVQGLINELDEQTSSVQDAAARAGQEKSPRALERVQQQLLRAGLDSRIVASAIAQQSGSPEWDFIALDFSEVVNSPGEFIRKPIPSLIRMWREERAAAGKRIVQTEKDLREILSTNADLVSASANLRLQSRVFWLTVVSVLAAIIATIAAVYAVVHPGASSAPASDHSTPALHSASAVPHAHASLILSQTWHPSASRTTES